MMLEYEVRVYTSGGKVWCQIKNFEPFEITTLELTMLREFLFDLEVEDV